MLSNPFHISPSEALFGEGEISFLHNGKESLSSAYDLKEKARIKIKLPRSLGVVGVGIHIYNESRSSFVLSVTPEWCDLSTIYDEYSAVLPLSSLGAGLYFFAIEISTIVGKIYARKSGEKISFGDYSLNIPFQLSVSDFAYEQPRGAGGVIYHIFVDRFMRGGNIKRKPGEVFVEEWNSPIYEYPAYPGAPLKNNYFYGGSLYGVKDKLPYIKSLGVTAIYLSPIFESPSNHKYDTADYMRVDSDFGGDEALRALIKSAKKLGISIILDGVFNHTGADSIYFNKFGSYDIIGAYQSKNSEFYSWFDFKSYPDDYTSWWGIEILPRINPDTPQCREYFVGKGGVIEKYAKMGIGGLRLDVVDELSDSFVECIKERLCVHDGQTIVYGEVWEDASNKIAYGKRKKYYLGKELDGVMNYPLRRGLLSFLREGKDEELRYALTDIMNNAPKRIRDMQMNLIGTHDTERAITALGGESPIGKSNDYLFAARMTKDEYDVARRRLMLAYTSMATLPGVPTIFYGDEAGLEGYGDPFNRRTYPWDNADKKLLSHYRRIGKIRTSNDVYKAGDFKLLYLDRDILIFERYDNKFSYITIINNSKKDLNITFSKSALSLFDAKRSKIFRIQSEESLIVKANKHTHFEF